MHCLLLGWTRICNTQRRSTCQWVGCLRGLTLLPGPTVTSVAVTYGRRHSNFVMQASRANSSDACSSGELHTPTEQHVSNTLAILPPERSSFSFPICMFC